MANDRKREGISIVELRVLADLRPAASSEAAVKQDVTRLGSESHANRQSRPLAAGNDGPRRVSHVEMVFSL